VVHLGIGAFHRAHQAVVFDDLARNGDLRWGVRGVSLRSTGVRDALNPQDGLYSLIVRSAAEERVRVIGAVGDVLVAPENPAAVVAALAGPAVDLVTITVTEKGYRLDPASGTLCESDPDVAADLASLAAPRTVPGLLVAALAERRRGGLEPFTALSCDNLPANGARLRSAVLAMAARHDPALCDWIAERGAFPASMVDRIVPATTAEDIAALAVGIGVEDRAMVKTEPFFQWVIEDHFAGARPDFGSVGVQMTADVASWEEAKLRLLNGAHSGIAYIGGLAGILHVDAVVALPVGRRFVEALWDEAETTLAAPPELDITAYRAELMARFANPALAHSTRQIAMDGSQKLPQRLLAPIAARLVAGRSIDALALAVAAWMRWQDGYDDDGNAFAVDDPLAARTAAARGLTTSDTVDRLLAIGSIFPRFLAGNSVLRTILVDQLSRLRSEGARAVLEQKFG
jgi:fructuronate reductase